MINVKWISPTHERESMVIALANIRCEWEEAACGSSLIEVDTSVGLLLSDIVNALELTTEERTAVLGHKTMLDLIDSVLA